MISFPCKIIVITRTRYNKNEKMAISIIRVVEVNSSVFEGGKFAKMPLSKLTSAEGQNT
jgi:hypothetical protein